MDHTPPILSIPEQHSDTATGPEQLLAPLEPDRRMKLEKSDSGITERIDPDIIDLLGHHFHQGVPARLYSIAQWRPNHILVQVFP